MQTYNIYIVHSFPLLPPSGLLHKSRLYRSFRVCSHKSFVSNTKEINSSTFISWSDFVRLAARKHSFFVLKIRYDGHARLGTTKQLLMWPRASVRVCLFQSDDYARLQTITHWYEWLPMRPQPYGPTLCENSHVLHLLWDELCAVCLHQ